MGVSAGSPPATVAADATSTALDSTASLVVSPQGFLVCRYLFVRCDSEPAPWSSEGGSMQAASSRLYCCAQPSHAALCLTCARAVPPSLPSIPALSPSCVCAAHVLSLHPTPLSADVGDRPGLETTLPKEAAEEMKKADKGQVFSMCDKPCWDWDAEKEEWGWAREAPVSQKGPGGGSGKQTARKKVGGVGGRVGGLAFLQT